MFVRENFAKVFSQLFSILGLSVLLSGSLVFLLFALGMVAGGIWGVQLALLADRVMGISLWLALLTTVVGMLQMYVARESALQMEGDEERLRKRESQIRQIEKSLEHIGGD